MNGKNKTIGKKFRRSWQILMIVLLNILIITAVLSPFMTDMWTSSSAVETLSKFGSRGDEVRQIQRKLKSLGLYKGNIDGIYGTATRDAVKQFQRNCGITVDGIAGPKTLLYLGITGGTSGSSSYSSSDINLLARVISAEARGESYEGQVAVGAVVLNRIEHSSFPDTMSGVIYQPGAFSCLNDSNWSQPVAASAKKAAQDAINGWDPTGGAIYYYNPKKTSNQWMLSRPIIKRIGNHVFCK